ncbi:MAG: hypothetical protein ABSF90_19255 [Syntrophobacteraceae bacterium]|jgi:hypothetical protein
MAIRKRGSGWQIDYFDPTGKRVRKSFAKKKDAQDELAKRVSLIAEKRYLDVKKDYTTTLEEILKKYEENFCDQQKYESPPTFPTGCGSTVRIGTAGCERRR